MTNAARGHRATWFVGSAAGAGVFLFGIGSFLHAFKSSGLWPNPGKQCSQLGAWLDGGLGPAHLGVGFVTLSVFVFFLTLLALQAKATYRYLRSLRVIESEGRIIGVLSPILEMLALPRGRVRLVDSPAPLCFTAGFFRPKIYVSAGALRLLDGRELLAVMTHEKYHLTSGDPARSAVLRALSRAFFFLPVMRSLETRYATIKEVAADAEALKAPGGGLALAGALYKLTASPAASFGGRTAAVASLFAQHSLFDLRVSLIAGRTYKPVPLAWSKIISSVLVLAAFALVLVPSTRAETGPRDCASPVQNATSKTHALQERSAPQYSTMPASSAIKINIPMSEALVIPDLPAGRQGTPSPANGGTRGTRDKPYAQP